MAELVHVMTSADFTPEKIGANALTFVDFWATWCGPCRMMAPIVEELAAETPDVVFGKVDVDQNPDIAGALGIASIPTLMLFKNGKLVDKAIGVTPKAALKQMIDNNR